MQSKSRNYSGKLFELDEAKPVHAALTCVWGLIHAPSTRRSGAQAARLLIWSPVRSGGAEGKGLSLKVGIYNEDQGGGIGGAESVMAVLADAMLSEGYDVDVLHRIPMLSVRDLVDNFGTTLDGVRLRYVDAEREPPVLTRNARRRYEAERRRHRS